MQIRNRYNKQTYKVVDVSDDGRLVRLYNNCATILMATSDLEVVMQKFNETWTDLEKINFLERKIILLSIAYYEHNLSPISDHEYDEMCFQLVDMLNKCKDREKTTYWYVFEDFDGNTGADLYKRLARKDKSYLNQLTTIYMRTQEKQHKPADTKQKSVQKRRLF